MSVNRFPTPKAPLLGWPHTRENSARMFAFWRWALPRFPWLRVGKPNLPLVKGAELTEAPLGSCL
jgi:hypothetical protein